MSLLDNRPSWDDYFMNIALIVSCRSHDPNTKHGSVLVNSKNQIIGVGYNGFPRGSNDYQLPLTRPEKYEFILHSEVNCLMSSPGPLPGENYKLYVTGLPCPNCFLQIVQYGIHEVIYGPVTSHCVDKSKEEIVKMLAVEHSVFLKNYYPNTKIFVETLEKYRENKRNC